ncbi:MAG: hypothetical protein ACSLFO_05350 [Acidimicrobiales bacterium]
MTTDTTPTDRPADPADPDGPHATRRTVWLAAAAAVVVATIGVGVAFSSGDGDAPVDSAGPPLELSLGAGDAMASCLPVEAEFLADMPMAFAGTVTAVEGDLVTLEVDRWYTGGDADVVELRAQGGQAALIAGFEFETGERYLVSAFDASVNFCGFSGPATPELTAIFDEAFAG